MALDERQSETVPQVLEQPQISLLGDIDKFSVERFLGQLAKAEQAGGDIALELTTLGGDADLARRIVLEVDRARARCKGRFLFLGKTTVYSAGATIMSAFPCRDRWLTQDTMLMIHGRKLEERIEALLAQLNLGVALEEENFRRLVAESSISLDELREKALHNWYLDAAEARERGLIAGILPVSQSP